MKRGFRIAAAGAVLAMATAGLARAADVDPRCGGRQATTWPAAAFGGYQMGQAVPCAKGSSDNCSLTDSQGGEYGVRDGRVRSISLYTSAKTGSLPFGLKHQMGLEAATKAYKASGGGKPNLPELKADEGEYGDTLSTGYCLLGADGQPFTVLLHFDDHKRLHKIEYGSAD